MCTLLLWNHKTHLKHAAKEPTIAIIGLIALGCYICTKLIEVMTQRFGDYCIYVIEILFITVLWNDGQELKRINTHHDDDDDNDNNNNEIVIII